MLSEIFAPECAGCKGRCETGLPLCDKCRSLLAGYKHFCQNCGHPLGADAKVCGHCLGGAPWDRIYIDYRYTGALKKLLLQIKFGYRVTGMSSLGLLVHATFLQKYDIITDVPSHFTRKLRRIAHPARSLAKHIAVHTGTHYEQLLVRNRKTEYQYKLKSRMRHINVKGAFFCGKDLSNLKILLVDDIITTGATVKECCKILKQAGAVKTDVYVLSGGRY
ncbi:double zinc ribbon domain-containing protein [Seleniivibrio sp.]|uniref:ComF family protein n=1 Tax=Seleniivibrio sp. TaxID=2898801 RepID=UPI0025D6E07F|nr:double zinc ribbon domain-containing protein [Seleniivibrio sp.]MCD8554435.1 double zinc ribbon domain-containing protein [Seleniivibrio sp.]